MCVAVAWSVTRPLQSSFHHGFELHNLESAVTDHQELRMGLNIISKSPVRRHLVKHSFDRFQLVAIVLCPHDVSDMCAKGSEHNQQRREHR